MQGDPHWGAMIWNQGQQNNEHNGGLQRRLAMTNVRYYYDPNITKERVKDKESLVSLNYLGVRGVERFIIPRSIFAFSIFLLSKFNILIYSKQ
jgi:hypothetical protein